MRDLGITSEQRHELLALGREESQRDDVTRAQLSELHDTIEKLRADSDMLARIHETENRLQGVPLLPRPIEGPMAFAPGLKKKVPSGGSKGQLPGFKQWSRMQKRLFWTGLSLVSPLIAGILGGVVKKRTDKVCLGFGAQVTAAAGAGVSGGGGVVFSLSEGKIGGYGNVNGVAGGIVEVAAGLQWTIIRGKMSAFSGLAYMVGADGGEIVGGGVGLYFTLPQLKFLGASISIGIAAGSPFNVYTEVGNTWTS